MALARIVVRLYSAPSQTVRRRDRGRSGKAEPRGSPRVRVGHGARKGVLPRTRYGDHDGSPQRRPMSLSTVFRSLPWAAVIKLSAR